MFGKQSTRIVYPVLRHGLAMFFLGFANGLIQRWQFAAQRSFFAHDVGHRHGFDLIEGDRFNALKAHRPGEQCGDSHRDQYPRDARVGAAHYDHDGERPGGNEERRPMRLGRGRAHGVPNGLVMMCGLFAAYTEYFVELRGGDDDGGGIGETDNHRMRQEVHHDAEPQQAEAELKQADEQRQGDGIGDVSRTAAGRDRFECRGRE